MLINIFIVSDNESSILFVGTLLECILAVLCWLLFHKSTRYYYGILAIIINIFEFKIFIMNYKYLY